MSDQERNYLLLSANFLLFGKNPLKEMGQFHAIIENKFQGQSELALLTVFFFYIASVS